MGTYLNPGNSGFAGIVNDLYIDKTGLIALINDSIGTPRKLTCISRPRRFGKSFAAQMLCAYYDRTCDSSALFADKEISRDGSYREHLNQYIQQPPASPFKTTYQPDTHKKTPPKPTTSYTQS